MGIEGVDPALVLKAPEAGYRIKLVGTARRRGEDLEASVRPVAVPADSHLGLVQERNNAVVVQTAEGGEMVYMGTGSGALPVATAVLNDLIGVCDPSHSWTGRFPAAGITVVPRRFPRWLVLREGAAAVIDGPAASAVPVLDPRAGSEEKNG